MTHARQLELVDYRPTLNSHRSMMVAAAVGD